jgi:hypothetical protein
VVQNIAGTAKLQLHMKKLIYLLLSLFLIISCSIKKSDSDNKAAFDKYVKSLNQITLPLHHSSHEGEFSNVSKLYDTVGFEKYKHVWTSMPLGKLYENDSIVVLVDLSYGDFGQVPFITSFDRNGNKIDSLGPYKKTGSDMGYSAVEYVTFYKDWTIVVADSVKVWKLNSDESDIIPNSETITIDTTYYKIDKLGKIIQVVSGCNNPKK